MPSWELKINLVNTLNIVCLVSAVNWGRLPALFTSRMLLGLSGVISISNYLRLIVGILGALVSIRLYTLIKLVIMVSTTLAFLSLHKRTFPLQKRTLIWKQVNQLLSYSIQSLQNALVASGLWFFIEAIHVECRVYHRIAGDEINCLRVKIVSYLLDIRGSQKAGHKCPIESTLLQWTR